jgi:hypothetical protein
MTLGLIDDQVSEVMDQLPPGDRVKVTDLVRTSGVTYNAMRHALDTEVIPRQSKRGRAGSTVARQDAALVVAAVIVASLAGVVFIEALKTIKALSILN